MTDIVARTAVTGSATPRVQFMCQPINLGPLDTFGHIWKLLNQRSNVRGDPTLTALAVQWHKVCSAVTSECILEAAQSTQMTQCKTTCHSAPQIDSQDMQGKVNVSYIQALSSCLSSCYDFLPYTISIIGSLMTGLLFVMWMLQTCARGWCSIRNLIAVSLSQMPVVLKSVQETVS